MRGVMIQLQVIHALLLREVKTRFGEHHLGYGWALLEPMMWVGAFLAITYTVGRTAPHGLPVFDFFVIGIVTYLGFRNTVRQASAGISGNAGLLLFPQVRPLDLVGARVILELATQFVVFVILMSVAVWLRGSLIVDNVLETLAGFFLMTGLGCGLGLVFCGLSVFIPTVERIQGALLRPLFWTSAVFYSADSVPSPVRDVILLNPLTHCIELVRDGWFPGYSTSGVSFAYPAFWMLLLWFFGLSLERVARRRLELT
jgi:capsular polysaccharide transport system permease protein